MMKVMGATKKKKKKLLEMKNYNIKTSFYWMDLADQTVQKKMNEPEDRAIQLSKLKHKEEEPQ